MYEYFDEMYAVGDEGDGLEHHGILGQKWGIRRFQNYDGTLIHPKGGRKRGKTSLSKALNKYETKKSQRQYDKFITSSKDDKKFRRAISRAADDWYSDDKRSRDEWEYPEAEGSKEKFIDAVAKNPNLYRGTAFMDAASTYYRDDKILNKIEKKEAKAAKEAEEKAKKEEEERVKTRADIDKAIANVDVKEIARLKGQMTLEDLQEASKRALAIGQIGSGFNNFKNAIPKEKSVLDKVLGGLETTKKIADTVKNAHQSVSALKKEFGFDKESILKEASKDEDNTKKGSKSDKGKKESKSDDSAEKKANSVFNRIKDLTSKINEDKEKRQDRDSKPKANFASPFKLGNGDYSVFKTPSQREKNDSWINTLRNAGNITTAKLTDISVPKTVTSTVKKITSPSSPTGQTTINDIKKMFSGVDSLTDDLLKRNQL